MKMKTFKINLLLAVITLNVINASELYGELKLVNTNELDQLINTKNLVVLVAVSDLCGEICEQKKPLFNELHTTFSQNNNEGHENIVFYATKDSSILQKYGISKYPTILFFRWGHFIVYENETAKEDLINWLQETKIKTTIELNDNNFEHDTQASTGGTTGDWFLLFHKSNCGTSVFIQNYFEQAALKYEFTSPNSMKFKSDLYFRLKGQINFAYVNLDDSQKLQKRFHIYKSPTIIFFRHGLMYQYEIDRFDVDSLVHFSTGWYKNVKAEKVPKELTFFDNILETITDLLKENNKMAWYCLYGAIGFIIIATLILLRKLCKTSNDQGSGSAMNRTNTRFKFD